MYCDGQVDVSHSQLGPARLGMSTPCPVIRRAIHCMPRKAED